MAARKLLRLLLLLYMVSFYVNIRISLKRFYIIRTFDECSFALFAIQYSMNSNSPGVVARFCDIPTTFILHTARLYTEKHMSISLSFSLPSYEYVIEIWLMRNMRAYIA